MLKRFSFDYSSVPLALDLIYIDAGYNLDQIIIDRRAGVFDGGTQISITDGDEILLASNDIDMGYADQSLKTINKEYTSGRTISLTATGTPTQGQCTIKIWVSQIYE